MTAHLLTESRHGPFASRVTNLPSRFRPVRSPAPSRIRIHLATTGPEPGNWLISITGDDCRVFKGSLLAHEARVYTASDIGIAILDGLMPLRDALGARLVDYEGDIEALRYVAASFGLDTPA